MNEKKVQRKWALVVAIIFTMSSIAQVAKGIDVSDSYGLGGLIGLFFFPAIFYYLAFKKKKGK
ncbi:hypothetical protein [Candidatus Enterococcus mansonii]|uniref:Uncharacterized protein n=1 Tax=Candidatus Enterococcus mansonii TaxID=1834181 RepID=A0A242CDU9_9ENTE|nr:hypothetical protein [Enterococcus sp. 4G2_DIV0659]OTO08417.1 hypothetical protein A5880_001417 [Enterococcus sp. 4G2_DIV0659]